MESIMKLFRSSDGQVQRAPQASTRHSTRYMSVNKERGTGFYCEAPPGSKHATRLQKVCATVQDSDSQDARTIMPSQQPVNSGAMEPKPVPETPTSSSLVHRSTSVRRASTISSARSAPSSDHHPTTLERPKKQLSVDRYQCNGQVAYHHVSEKGEVYISAPETSAEAAAMDRAASRLRRPQKAQNEESEGKGVQRTQRRR